MGFELDIMEAVSRRLGVKTKMVDVGWDQLVPALLRGDFDIAFNGLEPTEERKQVIKFTDPYYLFSQQITVRAGERRIARFEDLRGRRVGTLNASLAHSMLLADGKIKVVDYPGPVEVYKDLEIGRIEAGFMDVPMAVFYAGPNPRLDNVGRPVGEAFYSGGIRNDSPVFEAKMNQVFRDMRASGEMKTIYEKWGLWNDAQKKLSAPAAAPATAPAPMGLKKFIPLLAKGAAMTVAISILAMALAVVAGFGLCVGKLYGNRLVRFLAGAYIELVRGTPLLIQLYLIYYGLPNIGIELHPLVAAVLGIGLNYAACEAEIYRAGLLSIPKGQDEAARSIGMNGRQSLFHIVLPQAVRTILPPSTSDFIALFKDTSLVSVITVVELTKAYSQAATTTFRFLELGLLTAALYFIMSYPLALWSRRLEAKQRETFEGIRSWA